MPHVTPDPIAPMRYVQNHITRGSSSSHFRPSRRSRHPCPVTSVPPAIPPVLRVASVPPFLPVASNPSVPLVASVAPVPLVASVPPVTPVASVPHFLSCFSSLPPLIRIAHSIPSRTPSCRSLKPTAHTGQTPH
ncbi:unnamed protein product [Closterium sp. Yama58-4]|nr:unnamed protein product [Closterium sp. Yama58-4]